MRIRNHYHTGQVAWLMKAALTAQIILVGSGLISRTPAADREPGIGEQGILTDHRRQTVLIQTSLEEGESWPAHPDHERLEGGSHTGAYSLHGRVTKTNTAAFLKIPFAGVGGRRLELSFWIRSPNKAKCAIWVTMDGINRAERKNVATHTGLKAKWMLIKASALPQTDRPGFFEIVAPSSHGAPPGEVWIDDVQLAASQPMLFTLRHSESFPAMTTDGAGRIWLAVLARSRQEKEIRIYRIGGHRRIHSATLKPAGATGLGAPSIAPLSEGLLLATPVEQKNRWRIAWTRVTAESRGQLACHYLQAGGTANIAPALATHDDRACVVWESSGEGPRGIYASFISAANASPPQRLSSQLHVSGNPDVVALPEGCFFSAWDSCRGNIADLYGAWFKNGSWQSETRLTRDPRIERHVDLATRQDEVWVAWQAQGFRKHSLNLVQEQRIVVARLAEDGLRAPLLQLFEKVSSGDTLLMRPQVAVEPAGRLWLTVRKSMGQHEGWQPLAWCYAGGQWSEPNLLWPEQGRWTPVVMTFTKEGGLAAFQRDDLPRYWNIQVGKAEDWHSEVLVTPLSKAPPITAGPLRTELLSMPETDFQLADHKENFSINLPRQSMEFQGRRLNLYWGDLHNHTDLSVCQRAANPPIPDLYANQRDIEQLDFTAITDHGYNLDHPQWAYNAEQVRAYFEPDRFVTLLGEEEWTSDHLQYQPRRPYRRYGHRNLIFRDVRFPRFFDSRDGSITPRQVWNRLSGVEFITIPHQLADTGNCPTDWTYHDEHHQPLAEIFQTRQSYEYLGAPRQAARATPFHGHFLQDAWALGIIIGVIASPDHGGGNGKAGVWCESLSRAALFNAFHARHTFGTSGAKMSLFVNSGPYMMGDKVLWPKGAPIPFRVQAVTDRAITRVVIFRNNRIVHDRAVEGNRIDFSWTDPERADTAKAWYYVRIHREDGELAWSSPIWFFKTQHDLEATIEHAHELPKIYPEGVPTDSM